MRAIGHFLVGILLALAPACAYAATGGQPPRPVKSTSSTSSYSRSPRMPDVRGRMLAQAQAVLARYPLHARVVSRATNAADPGIVIDQNPAPGAYVNSDTMAVLTVAEAAPISPPQTHPSFPPIPFPPWPYIPPESHPPPKSPPHPPAQKIMPDLIGRTRLDAMDAVLRAQLAPPSVSRAPAPRAPDTVVAQSPAPGAPVQAGQGTQIVVSSGPAYSAPPPPAPVTPPPAPAAPPNPPTPTHAKPAPIPVAPKPHPAPAPLSPPATPSPPPTLPTQPVSPPSELKSPPPPPPPQRMPDLVGLGEARALAELRRDGLPPPMVNHSASATSRDTVIAQSPAPGADLAAGAIPAVTVSGGPEWGLVAATAAAIVATLAAAVALAGLALIRVRPGWDPATEMEAAIDHPPTRPEVVLTSHLEPGETTISIAPPHETASPEPPET